VSYTVATMNATIAPNEIAVRYASRPDVGREFLTFDVPNGWSDVKPLTKKVLVFDSKKFVFSCWNSDLNECVFYRMLDGSTLTATVCRK